MAVMSNAFSGVTLTDEDAKKFHRQVTYGKPKKEAKDTLERGVQIAENFRQNGRTLVLSARK